MRQEDRWHTQQELSPAMHENDPLKFPGRGPDPLPPEVEPELRELDARIRRLLGGVEVPPDLVERIYRASADRLPAPVVARVVGGRRVAAWGGRVALAAMLGVAFVVAALSLRSTNVTPGGAEAVAIEPDLGWLADGPREQVDDLVSHLLETGDLRSMDEMRSELESLVSSLESEVDL